MKDDDIESLLAFDLCERHPEEDDWRLVAMGHRDPNVMIAERRRLEISEAVERKRALFSPASEHASIRMRDALREQFFSEPSSSSTAPVRDSDVIPMVETRRRRASLTSAAWGGVMAIAAVLALVLLFDRPGAPSDAEPLTSYELRFSNTWSGPMRSASAGAPEPGRCEATYHRDHSVTIRLHPRNEASERMAVAALARSESGSTEWWPPAPPEQGVDGVLTIRRSVAEVGLEPGVWTLHFFITRSGERFNRDELRELEPGTHPGVTVVQTTVCIEG